jgi:hypothetical protein
MEFVGTWGSCDVSVSVVSCSRRFEERRAFISKDALSRALNMKRHKVSKRREPLTQQHSVTFQKSFRSCSLNAQYHYGCHQNPLLNTWARSSQLTEDISLGPFRRPVLSCATATAWTSAVGFSWRCFLIAQIKFSETVATFYIFRDKIGNECTVTRDTNVTSNLGRNWAFESKVDRFGQTEK